VNVLVARPLLRRLCSATVPLIAAACVFIDADDIADRAAAGDPTPTLPDPGPTGPSAIAVRVRDPAGRPVPNAQLTLTGAIPTARATDAAGWASVEAAPGPWQVAVSAPGWTPAARALTATRGQTTTWEVTLARTTARTLLRVPAGGAITDVGRWSLDLPPAALDQQGTALLGEAALAVYWALPEDGATPPAIGVDGAPLTLHAALSVAPGVPDLTATAPWTWRVAAPIGSPLADATALRLYRWSADGWIDVDAVPAAGSWAAATLDGFGWWALGQVAPAACAAGQLVDPSGAPVPGAHLRRAEPDRLEVTDAWTAADGSFCAPARQGSAGLLHGIGRRGADVVTVTADAPIDSGACAEACAAGARLAGALFRDADADGWTAGPGGDCDDTSAAAAPGADDPIGDGTDANCDGVDGVDKDGDRSPSVTDCDDLDPDAAPDAAETCDGRDNDCDGAEDEAVPNSFAIDRTCATCDPQAVADLQPVLYWTFDDPGTAVIDHSGNGHDGTLLGATPATRYPGVAHPEADIPWFAGTNDQGVVLRDIADWPTDALSVSLWWKSPYRGHGLVSYTTAETDAIGAEDELLLFENFRGMPIQIRDIETLYPVLLPRDTWHHLAVTWARSGDVQVFVNGLLVHTDTLHDPADTGDQPFETSLFPGGTLYVGVDQDCHDGCIEGLTAFTGLIDEFAVFDHVLDEREVRVLYGTGACGEGAVCNALDDDGDGLTDEHLVGSPGCPADDCQAIADTRSHQGDGTYTLDFGEGPFPATCVDLASGTPSTEFCGDGDVYPPTETCDGDADCAACARVVPAARHCGELLALGYTADGPYQLDLDGDGPTPPQTVRCDLTGGGWTLLVHHDTRPGFNFASEADALLRDRDLPFSSTYSILSDLHTLDQGQGYELRLDWPGAPLGAVTQWRQTSDPSATTAVTGYVPIAVLPNNPPFRGLALSGLVQTVPPPLTGVALLDGDGGADPIPWYAIGMWGNSAWKDSLYGMPAAFAVGGDGSWYEMQLWGRPG
jgi:hypothetical protein